MKKTKKRLKQKQLQKRRQLRQTKKQKIAANRKYTATIQKKSYRRRTQKPAAMLNNNDDWEKKSNYVSGPWDALMASNSYEKAARSAANRIELAHPGFFAKYGSKPDVLIIIWELYASIHRGNEKFYDILGNNYVDEEAYDNLIQGLEWRAF